MDDSDDQKPSAPRLVAVAEPARGLLAPSVPAPDAAYMRPPPERRFSMRDLLLMVFYYRRLVLLVAIFPAALGIGAAAISQTRYAADAKLIVFVGHDGTVSQDLASQNPVPLTVQGLRAVESEREIILSEDVLEATIQQIGISTLFPGIAKGALFGLLPPGTPADQLRRAADRLRSRLLVESHDDTNVISVDLSYQDRALAVRTVAALLDAYFERRRAIFANPTSGFLDAELKRMRLQLADIEARIARAREEAHVVDIGQDITLATARLDFIERRIQDLQAQRASVEAELKAAHAARIPDRVFAERQVTNEAANDESRNTLLRLQVDREHLIAQYSTDYPGVKELDRKIAAVRATILDNARPSYFSQRDVRNPVADTLASRVIGLQLDADGLDQQIATLREQAHDAEGRVTALRDADLRLHELAVARENTEQIIQQFALREAGTRAQEEATRLRNANVSVVQAPSAPVQGRNLRFSYIAAGLLSGMLLGVAVAILATWFRDVFLLPSEAERELGLETLADFTAEDETLTSPVSRQRLAHLATQLLDVTIAGRQLSIVQFVSAGADDGKSVLVRALGLELAQSHQLRTLIVDLQGDGRGHLRALGGQSDPALPSPSGDIIAWPTATPNLWVTLEAGKSTLASSRALAPQSRHLLEALRKDFDMILIAGDLQVGAYAARRLAGLVDANIVMVRAEHTRQPALVQLCDALFSSGARLLGMVFNGRRYYIPARIYRWL